MKQHLKRALELALVPLAAAIIFFEQTLIRYLNVAMAAFARLKWIARLEAWLVTLPPWAAFVAFAAPSLLILPIKLAAVVFVAHRKFGLAFGSILLGKVLATAILARLYRILRPNLMTLPWFARADGAFFYWRDQAYAFVKSLPAWQKVAALVARVRASIASWRAWLAELVSGLLAR